MEYKSVNVELKDLNEETGAFSAVFSTFNVVDSDQDVTRPGAFTDGEKTRVASWGHKWHELPVGKGAVHQDEEKAWIDGKFFLDTDPGLQTYRTVKNLGDLQEWSYGFDVLQESQGEFEDQRVRFLEKMAVHEVSPVLKGAGVDTRTENIKVDQLSNFSDLKDFDMRYTEEGDLLLDGISAFLDRTKSLADLRADDGRDLSEQHQARLKTFNVQLQELQQRITALLDSGQKDAADVGVALHSKFLALRQTIRS